MCGICGVFSYASRAVPSHEEIEAMCRRLAHRGPDGHRVLMRGKIGLGHTRLSVIDLAGGWQPIANEDGSVWVCCNGEIYNHRQLRRELIAEGHRFSTNADTEVIVHLYESHGPSCVNRLRGMFAFSIWDERCNRLLLARDRIGKKPLYYSDHGGVLLFASELKALAGNQRIARDPDPVALDQYLSHGYIPSPRSVYQGIKKVPPAHVLVCDDGEVRLERYWDLKFQEGERSREEWEDGVRSELRDAVSARLESEVPLGFFLSGGIDSSIVVALASEASAAPLKTFSIGFQEATYSELPYARTVATRFGTEHEECIVTADIAAIFQDLVWFADEPFADSSMVPFFYLSKMSRSSITVALGGDGGDEAFGGYQRYLGLKIAGIAEILPIGVRERLLAPLAACIPESTRKRDRLRQFKRLLQGASMPWEERYSRWMGFWTGPEKEAAYTPEFKGQIARQECAGDPLLLAFQAAHAGDRLSRAQWVDIMNYLPGDLLVKADRMSMAHGLELRSPFLDHQFMEFAATVPSNLKVHGLNQKYLLKRAFADVLPSEVLRRRKEGFRVPLADWLRGDLRPLLLGALLSPSANIAAIVKQDYVQKIVQEHLDRRYNHAQKIWSLLCLEGWSLAYGSALA